MAAELSGRANLSLSLMDRTQLPWEWEVGERGGQGASNTSLSSSSLFSLLSPGRLSCSCRWKFWALSSCWQHPVCQLTHSGFRLPSKSRHTKLHSQPALTPLLACRLIPGQNATTVLTVAFDGAAVSPSSVSSWGIYTVDWRCLFCFFKKLTRVPFQRL